MIFKDRLQFSNNELDGAEKLIWHTQVSLKVFILAWRLLQDRLPTKYNFHIRGIITDADISSTAGYGQVETADHMFMHCDTYGSIRQQVQFWLGFSGVDHQSLSAHFLHFTNYLGGTRTRRSFLQLICLLCVWFIWKECNNRILKNIYTPIQDLVEKVKFYSYR